MRYAVPALVIPLLVMGLGLPLDGGSWPVAAARAEEPKGKPGGTGSLTITHEGNYTEKIALVTLYQDGKPFRSAELEQGSAEHKKVTWEKLPAGLYEVHFEALGFKKIVKRVVLAEDGPEVVLRVQINLATEYGLGAGPSTQELVQEIATLKKDQAELRKKIDDLQAEVSRLKK
jgi:hypothetical protein